MGQIWYFCVIALVAQLVEQLPFKEMVVGSIPTEGTNEEAKIKNISFARHTVRH